MKCNCVQKLRKVLDISHPKRKVWVETKRGYGGEAWLGGAKGWGAGIVEGCGGAPQT